MVEHLVLFKWKEGISAEILAEIYKALSGLKEQIPGILELSVGPNFSDRSQGFDAGLRVLFDNRASLDSYGPHPAHQAVVQSLILPNRTELIVLDYEV